MKLPLDPLSPDLTPILETALDAVVVMREDGVVVGWNAVAERIFGWSREQAIGAQLSSLIIPEPFREAHHRGLDHYLATGEGPVLNRHIEISGLRADGEEFPVELSITPTNASGSRVFLGFLRDITERKAAEQLIRRRAAEAEAISELTTLAAESSSFEQVIQRCLECVCDITDWRIGHAFCLSEEDSDLLEDTGIWHAPPDADITPLVEVTRTLTFRSGVGLPGSALERRGPVWFADVEHAANFPRAHAAARLGLHAAFAFPISTAERVIAVLEFFHTAPAEPDTSLWPAFNTLGEQVGRVFERTRAANALQQEREALLAEISRRQELEDHRRLLVNELNHRVKNMLTVVLAIATQTASGADSVDSFVETFSGRLAALATAHSVLTREQWKAAPFAELLHELLAPFDLRERQVEFDGPELMLQPRQLLALTLVIHELLTNALKHGALRNKDGSIAVHWTRSEADASARVELSWRECTESAIEPPQQAGFGSKLLDRTIGGELRGTLERIWHADGLELRITFPIGDQSEAVTSGLS